MQLKSLAAAAALLTTCINASAADEVTPWGDTPEVTASTSFACTVDAVGGTCVENEGAYTFTPNQGYEFSSLYENGAAAAAAKYVVNPDTGIVTYTPGKLAADTRTVIAAKAVKAAPEHKWWESPKVIAVPDMGVNTIRGGAFHPGLDETGTYAGMTIGLDGKYAAPVYTWASMMGTGAQPINSAAYTTFTNGLRGSAVSSALNVNLVGGGEVSSNMYSFPLNSATLALGENSFVIENDQGSHIDNFFFSANKQFLYASELVYDTKGKKYVSGSKLYKWQVLNGLKSSGTNLIQTAELHDFTNRVSCAAFATIGGHEIYYALVGAECIKAYDITAGREYTVISAEEFAKLDTKGLKDCDFGSLAISGLGAGAPHLTILLSAHNQSTYLDTLSVYSLGADGLSNATQVESFDYDEMKAFGIGIATSEGASALVSDDEGELVLGMSYSAKAQLFAVKYVAKYRVDFATQYGTAPESQTVYENEKLTAPVAPKASGYTLTGWFTNLESGVAWNFDTDVVKSALTLNAKWEKVMHPIALFKVDGKGTVSLDQTGSVESGSSISGSVTDVAAGYIPYVFVDGTLVKTGAGAFVGTANDSAKVIVTYVKENAWYLQPFVKNHAFLHKMSHESSKMGNCAISPDEKSFFTALSIQHYASGDGKLNGVYQFATAGLTNTVGVYLGAPENYQLASSKGGYLVNASEGFMSVVPLTGYLVTGAQQGGQGGNGNSMVYPLGGNWGGLDDDGKKIDADDRYLIDSDYSDVNNGTVGTYGTIGLQWLLSGVQSTDGECVYVGLHARGEITKAKIGTREGKLTLKKTGVFWRTTTASGTGSGTQAVALALYNDGTADHVYAYLADGRLVKLDEETLSGDSYANAYADSKGEDATVYDHKMIDLVNLTGKGTPYALKVIGAKEKTPRLVVQTKDKGAYVYALCTDGTLASTSPIATVKGSDLGVQNFNGLTGTDDELYAFANYGDGTGMYDHWLATVTARPANVTVRGTFGTYEEGSNTEIAYGAAANETFNAPTGYRLTAVKVNGVADANFTPAAYTFTDAELTKNVYIEMTIEKAPVAKVVSADGMTETPYTDLNAAFEAAQAGETVKLLGDLAVTESTTFSNKDVTFDLGGYTLSNGATTGAGNVYLLNMTASAVVITNGTLDAGVGEAIENTGASHITIAADATILGKGTAYLIWPRAATVDVYGTIINDTDSQSCIWLTTEGCVVNIYEGATVWSKRGDVFRHRCNTSAVSANSAVLNFYGGTINGVWAVHAYASGGSVNSGSVNIYGGTFECGTFEKTAEMSYGTLDENCTAKFKAKPDATLTGALASGCEFVKGDDNYWTVQKSAPIPPPQQDTPEAVSNAVVAAGFPSDGDMARNVKTKAQLDQVNAWMADNSLTAASFDTSAKKAHAYASFTYGSNGITLDAYMFSNEPEFKVSEIEVGEGVTITVSLKDGDEPVEMAKATIEAMIKVGTDVKTITGTPTIVTRPSADGANLEFTVAKPEGTAGFIKLTK